MTLPRYTYPPYFKEVTKVKMRPRHMGFTLLEIMIALSLGLLVAAAVGTIYIGSNQTYRVQESSARIQETGRYVLDIIGRSVRQAGYEIVSTTKDPIAVFAGTPIQGIDNICPTTTPVHDQLTVQFDGIENERDCEGDLIAAGQVVQHTFQIQGNSLRCTATQLAPNATLAAIPTDCLSTGVEITENIEDLQIIYGVDTGGNQAADLYVAAPNAGQWPNVISARVCVLVRSAETGITTSTQRYLNCQGALGIGKDLDDTPATTVAGDTRLRRAFVATFNLRNRVTTQP